MIEKLEIFEIFINKNATLLIQAYQQLSVLPHVKSQLGHTS